MTEQRYEISILVGPCSQEEAEAMMLAAHKSAGEFAASRGPGTSLNHWLEDENEPGSAVDGVDVP